MLGDDNTRPKGAIPTQHIFDRAISRKEMSGSGYKTFSNALVAAEELAVTQSKQKSNTPIDSIALANIISSFADKDDNNIIFYGYTWKWQDDRSSLSVDTFSSVKLIDLKASPPGEVVTNDTMERSEPYSPPRKVCVCMLWTSLDIYSRCFKILTSSIVYFIGLSWHWQAQFMSSSRKSRR
jgi:hypothetical protein